MATSYSTGTVSISNGSTALTGVGTSWVVNGILPGDVFEANGLTIEIASVASATSITLARAWPGTTLSGNNYSIRFTPVATRVLTQINTLLAQLANGVLSGLSGVTSPAADKLAYLTGAATWGLVDFKSWARGVVGAADIGAGRTAFGLGSIATQAATNINIDGGAIDGTSIGGTSPAAGVFTTLSVTGVAQLGSAGAWITGTNVFKPAVTGGNGAYIRSQLSNASFPSFSNVDNINSGMFLPGGGVVGFTTGGVERMRIDASGGVIIAGALSKGSGSFRIDHPLPALTETHDLVHSFVEAPTADNIYRGKDALSAGTISVNIDTAAGMTEGTFTALNGNVQVMLQNNTGWTAVKGSVSGNMLTITAQDATATDEISWLVIGERQDKHMLETAWTDEFGRVTVEPLKATPEPIEEAA